jgi:hypothetical protein
LRDCSEIPILEAWLSHLPGRVEAWTTIYNHGSNEDVERKVAFEKSNKEWVLAILDFHNDGSDRITNWTLLRDASVEDKIRALECVPDLLRAISQAQRSTIERATKVAADFDELATKLKITAVKKEGA